LKRFTVNSSEPTPVVATGKSIDILNVSDRCKCLDVIYDLIVITERIVPRSVSEMGNEIVDEFLCRATRINIVDIVSINSSCHHSGSNRCGLRRWKCCWLFVDDGDAVDLNEGFIEGVLT